MRKNYKIGVLLSGCGVYDGSEIHESVFTLYEISKLGMEYICLAPNVNQHHVINHTTGEEMQEYRNVLIESARIARGEIFDIEKYDLSTLDALILPGGFGTAKNHTKWAFEGAKGPIHEGVKYAIQYFLNNNKPICGICMAPTTIVKAAEGMGRNISVTIGNETIPGPYDLKAIGDQVNSLGGKTVNKLANESYLDETNRIVTTPTYMMEANIVDVFNGIQSALTELKNILESAN